MNVAKDIIKTLTSIEDDISQCERQIAAPISKMNTLKEGESIDKTWEIIIKNSPQRNMKLELHIQSAAGQTSFSH